MNVPTCTLIVAVPSFNPVTTPCAFTVATVSSLELQIVGSSSVVFTGSYTTDNASDDCPFLRFRLVFSNEIPFR